MLARGVALPPSPFEAVFPSLAHGKEELERTVDVAAAAAASAAVRRRTGDV
jgi:glutamate-1-semialdehyde 2,1-aminomutase